MKITAEIHERRTDIILGMTDEARASRKDYIGASDANIILGGDKDAIHKLWQMKRGEAEPDDLSNVLPVQMGIWTEQFNLLWFEKQTGRKVEGRQEGLVHPHIPFIRASLDGFTLHPTEGDEPCVVDAKHVNGFTNAEECLKKYAPQLVVQMACADVEWGLLSILFGNFRWEWIGMKRDPLYESQVISALKVFWAHVQDGTPPVDIPSAEPPMPVAMMRKVDMSRNNMWSAAEDDYIRYEEHAKTFEKVKAEMKALVEDDVAEAKGKLVTVRRDKNGSLRFSKTKGGK